ncbi:MAG TPA: helix-turn-helix transcriptional regulator [Mycobacteriales bacterium]|nr:helix-turn-helix transcriptional regulator [Mycobacteriales bacterium]
MTSRVVPTMRRRRLGELLRKAREDKGLGVDEVAAKFEWSGSKVYRIERAAQGIAVSDARLLLDLYGVAGDRQEEVLALVREAKRRGWWHSYTDALPEPFAAFVGLEQDAASVGKYSSELIPGLLQTEHYARTIRRAALLSDTEETAERWLEVRARRQERLRGDHPLSYWVVLSEAVIRRVVGSPQVMREQLRKLLDLADLPNITVQVLPFEVGAHAAIGSAFTVVRFPEKAAPDVVYVELPMSCVYVEQEGQVERYNLIFDHVRASALDPHRSASMIASAAENLG